MTEDAQIVNLFSRWRNLEDEKARISEDSRELFAEAKGAGFDGKALRLAFRLAAKADEPMSDADKATQALADTYLNALGTNPALARVPRAWAEAKAEVDAGWPDRA